MQVQHIQNRGGVRRNGNRSFRMESVERRLLFSTFTVNTLSDALNPGGGLLTLRQAVADANAHAGANIIAFAPKLFAAGGLQQITLTQGEIQFTGARGKTTVDGPSVTALAINGNAKSRIFQISGGTTVAINGLTITNGTVNASTNEAAFGGTVESSFFNSSGEMSSYGVTSLDVAFQGVGVANRDKHPYVLFGSDIFQGFWSP